MFRRFVSLILVSSLLFHTFSNLQLIGAFYLYKTYFIEAFCINKSRPKLKCNGKCFLSQQLKQQNAQEEPSLPTIIQEHILPLMVPEKGTAEVLASSSLSFPFPTEFLGNYEGPTFPIFHPPPYRYC